MIVPLVTLLKISTLVYSGDIVTSLLSYIGGIYNGI